MEKKQDEFYKEDWFVILMLVLIFPLGLVLMWYYEKFSKENRLLLSAVFGTFFYFW